MKKIDWEQIGLDIDAWMVGNYFESKTTTDVTVKIAKEAQKYFKTKDAKGLSKYADELMNPNGKGSTEKVLGRQLGRTLKTYLGESMDILEKIELFLGEEMSGTAVGTTTGDVAKIPSGTKVMRRRKKGNNTTDVYDEPDEKDSEDKIRKGKKVKSGSAMINGMAARSGTAGMGANV